jgi:hypothetical protein
VWRRRAAEAGNEDHEILLRKKDDPMKRRLLWMLCTVSKRAVEVGRLTPWGIVLRGVSTGERILIAGAHCLRAGQSVRVQEPGRPG